MLFVALSIICSVLLGFIFKLYARYEVDVFQAIVVNYFTCVTCGWIYHGSFPIGPGAGDAGLWVPYALVLGITFITGFTCAALTVRYFGVTVSQVMQKMSIIATVPFAILVYAESASWMKLLGVALAVVAILLVNWPKKSKQDQAEESSERGAWWIPALTWILSAIIEMVFLWVKGERYVEPGNVRFISTVFGVAGALGLGVTAWGYLRGQRSFAWRNVIGGIALGVPNFGSMYFLLLALGSGLEGSFVFPVINMGIILLTTVGAVSLFGERLGKLNWVGVAIALAAILLMSQ